MVRTFRLVTNLIWKKDPYHRVLSINISPESSINRKLGLKLLFTKHNFTNLIEPFNLSKRKNLLRMNL